MQIKCLIIFIYISLTISSCYDSGSDYEKLKGHYFFRNKGSNGRSIYSENGVSKNIIYADVIEHVTNDSFILALQKPSLKYFQNYLGEDLYHRFLAYAQYLRNRNIVNTDKGQFMKGNIENDSTNYNMFLSRGADETNSEKDDDIEMIIADSLLKFDPVYKKIFSRKENYWILQLSKDTLLGPFSKLEYLKERKALHISGNLELEFVDE